MIMWEILPCYLVYMCDVPCYLGDTAMLSCLHVWCDVKVWYLAVWSHGRWRHCWLSMIALTVIACVMWCDVKVWHLAVWSCRRWRHCWLSMIALTVISCVMLCEGMTPGSVIAREMTALLAVYDRPHSNLIDSMPEKCGLTSFTKDYEPTLAEVIISHLLCYWGPSTCWQLSAAT